MVADKKNQQFAKDVDENFYDRADAIIDLANDQLKVVPRGKVSASCMYGTARFNTFVAASEFTSQDEMQAARDDIIAYFSGQYRSMIEEHVDDFIQNFDEFVLNRK